MHVIHRRGWEIPEHQATPEGVYLNRRGFLNAAAGAAAATLVPDFASAQRVTDIPDPTKDLYPAKRNEKYAIGDRPITPEEINGNYNNFYEFGTSKNVAKAAQALKIRPWTVKIDGMVEKPFEIGIDDLIKQMPLEERLYRHRCVEAWSMTIPWTGFPLAKLVELAKPLSSAKYRRDADVPGQDRRAGLAADLVSVALHRRADDGGGEQRTRVPRHRHVRQACAEADGRAAAARGAVEVRLQVDQIDRALQLHRPAAEELLGGAAGVRSTASGPTSIRRCRIRAGARRARK